MPVTISVYVEGNNRCKVEEIIMVDGAAVTRALESVGPSELNTYDISRLKGNKLILTEIVDTGE